jgi:hypothetical protein
MVFDDFHWHPILSATDVGDHLRSGMDDYARVVPSGHHDEWVATVNMQRPIKQHRSATFESKGEAVSAVHQWLRQALTSADFP